MRTRLWRASNLFVLAMLTFPGCGPNELTSPTAARLRGIANVYLDCAVAKNGKGPADEKELKKHMRNLQEVVLRMNGIDPNAIDAVFVSERDQEPFVILYGVTITEISGEKAPLVAHEKNGKNGKRLVVFANTKVEEVNDTRLQELLTPEPQP